MARHYKGGKRKATLISQELGKTRAYKKEKKALLNKLDELDKKAESLTLEADEIILKHVLNQRLASLLREEELKWYQRVKVKNFLEGDVNTKFYHLVANGKHRKTRIFQLEYGSRVVRGDGDLKKYITTYYKNLFSPSEYNTVTLDESQRKDIPQVSLVENEILTQ